MAHTVVYLHMHTGQRTTLGVSHPQQHPAVQTVCLWSGAISKVWLADQQDLGTWLCLTGNTQPCYIGLGTEFRSYCKHFANRAISIRPNYRIICSNLYLTLLHLPQQELESRIPMSIKQSGPPVAIAPLFPSRFLTWLLSCGCTHAQGMALQQRSCQIKAL